MGKSIQGSTQQISFLELEKHVSDILKEKVVKALNAHDAALNILMEEMEASIDMVDQEKKKQAIEAKEKASSGIVKISENMREIVASWVPNEEEVAKSSKDPGNSYVKKGMKDGSI